MTSTAQRGSSSCSFGAMSVDLTLINHSHWAMRDASPASACIAKPSKTMRASGSRLKPSWFERRSTQPTIIGMSFQTWVLMRSSSSKRTTVAQRKQADPSGHRIAQSNPPTQGQPHEKASKCVLCVFGASQQRKKTGQLEATGISQNSFITMGCVTN